MRRLVITTSDSGAGHLKRVYKDCDRKLFALTHRLVRHPAPSTDNIGTFFEPRRSICASQRDKCGYWNSFIDEQTADQFLQIERLWDDYDIVEFWADPYPNAQLALIQFLNWVQSHGNLQPGKLQLIQAESPLGERAEDDARSRNPQQQPVTRTHIHLAGMAWKAFCHATPENWAALVGEDLNALPCLKPSIVRMLEELPDNVTRLSKTEFLILQMIAQQQTTPEVIPRDYNKVDTLPVLDYWEKGNAIDELARAPNPAAIGLDDGPFDNDLHSDVIRLATYCQSELSLSDLGEALLNWKADITRFQDVNSWWRNKAEQRQLLALG